MHLLHPLHPLHRLNLLNFLNNLTVENEFWTFWTILSLENGKDKETTFWSMFWEKTSVENVILFCFTEDEGLCRHEEFFDGWWNDVQVFVDKKKWNEKNMENMKNVFDWWILPCQGTLLFHKYVYRTRIQDVKCDATWRFLRYTTFYVMC